MATIEELKELAVHAAKGTAPENFSNKDVNESFKEELKALAGDIYSFMKNRYDIYSIMVTGIDEVVPKKVIDAVGMFAEVTTVGNNEKAVFKTRVGKNRARKFLTRVAASGVYESFRLDSTTFTVEAYAIGGACTIDYERLLDGAEVMSDVMDIMTEALTDSIYVEVQKALRQAVNSTKSPAANRHISNTFEADKMVKLANVVRAYGDGAVIFAPGEFIAAMGPDAIVPVDASNGIGGVYHPQDIDAIHNQGYINIFRGTPIVQLPQSFTDDTNTKTWIDPQIAYVFPTGKERIVKVVLEGATQINDFKNRDNSMEINVYKKMGTAIITYNNWAIYQNKGITQTFDPVYNI